MRALKSKPKTATKKKKTAKKTGPSYGRIFKKVMKESIPYVESLIPIIIKAATNTGYLGTVGTGVAVLGLLQNRDVAKEAVRILIAKATEIHASAGIKEAYRKAFEDADDFADVQGAIQFKSHHTVLRAVSPHRTDDMDLDAKHKSTSNMSGSKRWHDKLSSRQVLRQVKRHKKSLFGDSSGNTRNALSAFNMQAFKRQKR